MQFAWRQIPNHTQHRVVSSPENERSRPLKIQWLEEMYFLLKVRPFLGDEFVSFGGCFFFKLLSFISYVFLARFPWLVPLLKTSFGRFFFSAQKNHGNLRVPPSNATPSPGNKALLSDYESPIKPLHLGLIRALFPEGMLGIKWLGGFTLGYYLKISVKNPVT